MLSDEELKALCRQAMDDQILGIAQRTARGLTDSGKSVRLTKGPDEHEYTLIVDGVPHVLSFHGPIAVLSNPAGEICGGKFAWGGIDSTAMCLTEAFLRDTPRKSVLGDAPEAQPYT